MSQTARLYIDSPLSERAAVVLGEEQAHYLRHVMRVAEGKPVKLFNGRDGEWSAVVDAYGKRAAYLSVQALLRPQEASPDVWLLFAPIKHGKIDQLAQKACELGVSRLQPVMTQHTAVDRVNATRLRANVVEAAEQCERLDVPTVHEPEKLETILAQWPQDRVLIHADESGQGGAIAAVLPSLRGHKLALLIGPEGGFSAQEKTWLHGLAFVRGVGMGARILRADTAAIAALAVIQALCGDWEQLPSFQPEV